MVADTSGHPSFDRLDAVARRCREGRRLAAEGDRSLALASYVDAWDLLPEPKASWDASTFILSAVGDLLRAEGDLGNALDVLVRLQGRTASGLAPAP